MVPNVGTAASGAWPSAARSTSKLRHAGMWPSYGTYEVPGRKGVRFAGTLGVMADESPATKQDIQELKATIEKMETTASYGILEVGAHQRHQNSFGEQPHRRSRRAAQPCRGASVRAGAPAPALPDASRPLRRLLRRPCCAPCPSPSASRRSRRSNSGRAS